MNSDRGYTLLELLITVSLVGVLMCMAIFNFKALQNPADNGAAQLASFFKVIRAKALASTLAYTVTPQSATRIITTRAGTCEGAQTDDPTQTLTLPEGSSLVEQAWSICYNPRGLSNSSADIHIQDSDRTRLVQVVLGGGVRIK